MFIFFLSIATPYTIIIDYRILLSIMRMTMVMMMMMRHLRKGKGAYLPPKRNGSNPNPRSTQQRKPNVDKERRERKKKRPSALFFPFLSNRTKRRAASTLYFQKVKWMTRTFMPCLCCSDSELLHKYPCPHPVIFSNSSEPVLALFTLLHNYSPGS